MKEHALATIEKYNMLSQGETVVLAVSGGVDSMVLMDLFSKIAHVFDLTIIVAHMDHAKRPESMLDARLVCQVAQKLDFMFEHQLLAQTDKMGNFHEYARNCRYAFFKEVALAHGATKVVTAHHANDQLETWIDRMMKTDVPEGLIGIQPKGKVAGMPVIRPFIDIEKKDIYAYAHQFDVAFREDISNASEAYLRNRIRRNITPLLVEERRDVLRHVRALSDHLKMDEAYFKHQVDQLMKEVKQEEWGYELRFSWLQKLPMSLSRRLLKRLVPNSSKGAMSELQRFLMNDAPSGACHVGCDRVVKKSYDKLLILNADRCHLTLDYQIKIAINEENRLIDGRKIVLKQGIDEKSKKNEAQGTYLCYNKVSMPLTVRNRRAGDRIRLFNGQGHASIKKVMIDAKIPIDEREKWPIIVDNRDRLVWVPGLKKSPVCLEKPNSSKDLWLEIYE